MSVRVGSARIDENGKAYGGAAGDQTGKEVMIQPWYNHSKGWVVLRPIDPADAEKIARNMEAACANNNIGYDQWSRNTLYNAVKPLGFDCAKLTVKKETDCSALVRVCSAYAGHDTDNAFRTTTQADDLMDTGAYIKLTASKYTTRSDYLKRGDILVTKTQGHTVVVLDNGPKAEDAAPKVYVLGERILKQGAKGPDVTMLQELLLSVGHDPQGIDGDFGPNTKAAVKSFQKKYGGLKVDGEYGPLTHEALMDAVDELPNPDGNYVLPDRVVRVTKAGRWNVRKGPGTTYKTMGVVSHGTELPYVSEADNGWLQVEYNGTTGWISGVCAEVSA